MTLGQPMTDVMLSPAFVTDDEVCFYSTISGKADVADAPRGLARHFGLLFQNQPPEVLNATFACCWRNVARGFAASAAKT